ncbi:MAG: phosphoadenylyl-sulfate reductase [Burkholderiaceae bacterium]|nr:phosphoadenylyl-sulfate reductase [Sulfuritalea sp.]MCF8175166.1 phosphoadenylyl-sulfate reductase [Burkholderiaceae bacterium]MCF8184511.1 phosphoadenylyl-sulfate reductase [Polynucleobacter sp.]
MIRESLPDLANPELDEAVARKAARAATLLRNIARDYAPVVFANSLGAEDMVLTDLIWRGEIDIAIFSLDTGRLPVETYELIHRAEKHYGRKLDVFFPRHEAVEAYSRTHGSHGFYDSVEARKACCHTRKVEPLSRALTGRGAWVTGLRAAQSATRNKLKVISQDTANNLVKASPLTDWSEAEVWYYLRTNRVPYNALHDRNYPSIGCAPCTRAIQPGEDVRAGRWWWENADTKECGLHRRPDGALVRASAEAMAGKAELEAPPGAGRSRIEETQDSGLHLVHGRLERVAQRGDRS